MQPKEESELKAKEFLKRIEIITMKKDLRKLREIEALKERDKIIKKPETKKQEQSATFIPVSEDLQLKEAKEKFEREKILNMNYAMEMEAEEQLKKYATEEEKQEIFIFDSAKIELTDKMKSARSQKEPELVMKKNELEIEKNKFQGKLNDIQDEEVKLEAEQKIISEKEKSANLPSEKEALEKRRWELEGKIQESEKMRWQTERSIQAKEEEIKSVDAEYEKMTEEENLQRQKIADIDNQLRRIYSQIIKRVQLQKATENEDRAKAQSESAKVESQRKEDLQRQNWTNTPSVKPQEKEFMKKISIPIKEKLARQAKIEEEQRRQFIQDVEEKTKEQN